MTANFVQIDQKKPKDQKCNEPDNMIISIHLTPQLRLHYCNALSFYVTKTVLVGPKWFWSDQIDLDLTIMIWSRPK